MTFKRYAFFHVAVYIFEMEIRQQFHHRWKSSEKLSRFCCRLVVTHVLHGSVCIKSMICNISIHLVNDSLVSDKAKFFHLLNYITLIFLFRVAIGKKGMHTFLHG